MKKNQLFLFLFIATFIASIFIGCKKGEKDPVFPFRTRDARLMQKWHLKKIEGSYITTSNPFSNGIIPVKKATILYDGSTYTETGDSTSYQGTNLFNLIYNDSKFELTIKEHGLYEYTEAYKFKKNQTLGTISTVFANTGEGEWIWAGDGEWKWSESSKKKDHVVISIEFGRIFKGGLYYIYRLSKKEMILKTTNAFTENSTMTTVMTNPSSTATSSNVTKTSSDITYTFENK